MFVKTLLSAGVWWVISLPAGAAASAETTALDRCMELAVDQPQEALVLARGAAPGLELCRGYAHEQLGELEAAARAYEEAVAAAERQGNTELLALALAQRGELAYYRGAYSEALADLDRAYRFEGELGHKNRQRYVLNAIANVYADERVGAYDRALDYYRQVFAANAAENRVREMATGHFNLASTYERKGDFHAALAEYEKALVIDRQRGDLDEVAFNERALAGVLVKLGRAREALSRLEGVIQRYTATGDEERLAQARLTRGIARRAVGEFAAALLDLDAAGERFRELKNDRYLARVLGERAEVCAALGDFASAFQARSEQTSLERRLTETLRDEQTSRLRVAFDTSKKEQENEALLRENELSGQALRDAERIRTLQRWILALGAGLLVLLGVLVLRQVAHGRRLQTLAMTDELTRVANRRSFLGSAAERFALARRGDRPLALLAFDLDHFKHINDHHGHEVGDHVLQRVAQTARTTLRQADVVGRVGGEEFLALLPETDLSAARDAAERLRAAIEQLELADLAPGLAVAVSVGIAARQPGDPDFATLARRADEALYRAKEAGRNRVVAAPPSV